MRFAWTVVLGACSQVFHPPADVRWRLVQQDYEDRRIGDAVLRPGSMIYLAPEPGRTDVLAVDPIPSHFAAGETVRIRVMILPQADTGRYRIRIVDRSPHLRVEPEAFELGRGEIQTVLLTSALPGRAELRLEAVAQGGVR